MAIAESAAAIRQLRPVGVAAALLVGVLAVASGLAYGSGVSALRVLGALLLILYLPGRSVRTALGVGPLELVFGFVADVATSLSCVVAVGFALDATSAGIQRSSVTWALVGITVVTAVVAAGRAASARRREGEVAGGLRPAWRRAADAARAGRGLAAAFLVFVVLGGGAVAAGVSFALGANQKVATTELSIGLRSAGSAVVQVHNLEHRPASSHLTVTYGRVTELSISVRLLSGASRSVPITGVPVVRAARLTATLYRGTGHRPYRQVWLSPAAS